MPRHRCTVYVRDVVTYDACTYLLAVYLCIACACTYTRTAYGGVHRYSVTFESSCRPGPHHARLDIPLQSNSHEHAATMYCIHIFTILLISLSIDLDSHLPTIVFILSSGLSHRHHSPLCMYIFQRRPDASLPRWTSNSAHHRHVILQ